MKEKNNDDNTLANSVGGKSEVKESDLRCSVCGSQLVSEETVPGHIYVTCEKCGIMILV